jgi:hypothetical protein
MAHAAALPFVLRRSHDVVGWEVTSTKETIHGLLRLDGDVLHIQWRVARSTDHVGTTIRTDHEVEPVREVTIPLALPLRGTDRTPGNEFAGELELALAERVLAAVEGKPQLASPDATHADT